MPPEKNSQRKSAKTIWQKLKYFLLLCLWPVLGFFSLLWFLIRVIPKPTRATYPCQRIAFPLASSFIIWLLGLFGSAAAFRKARSSLLRSRYLAGLLCIVISIGCIWLSLTLTAEKKAKAAAPQPVNSPVGIAKGIHPGRVVWVHDPNATDWAGPFMGDGYWWQSEHTDQNVVDTMVHNAICGLTGESKIENAWDALFRYYNIENGKGDVGYQAGEKIMIKVNFVYMIAVWGTESYNFIGREPGDYANHALCAPQIIHTLLEHLVDIVGVTESDITIGDPICLWCNEFYDMIQPDFQDVRYLDYLGDNNRTQAVKSTVPFYWSTPAADGKTRDYVMQSYVDAEYLINLANLKGHYNQAGITACGKNHYGSLRCPDAINVAYGYYNMHSDTPKSKPASGSYRNFVDLMGHEHVGGKTFLCIFDFLYSGKHAQYYDYPINQLPRKWQMQPFNNDWPSSIFASQDQVAIDSVGFDFLITEWPEAPGPAYAGTDDYLHEAAEANNPPSGTFYDPEDDGTRIESLGVHEHWNDPNNMQYSRNLGTGDGIELLKVSSISDGDFNNDGKVNFKDFSMLAQYWGQNNATVDVAPIPVPDGVVDLKDLAVLCENWLAGVEP